MNCTINKLPVCNKFVSVKQTILQRILKYIYFLFHSQRMLPPCSVFFFKALCMCVIVWPQLCCLYCRFWVIGYEMSLWYSPQFLLFCLLRYNFSFHSCKRIMLIFNTFWFLLFWWVILPSIYNWEIRKALFRPDTVWSVHTVSIMLSCFWNRHTLVFVPTQSGVQIYS